MNLSDFANWRDKTVTPQEVLAKIEPGMSIFLSTGMAEPRTLVKHLMASESPNLQDLEVIQLISLGDSIPIDERYSRKYRLKTFFAGWLVSDAVSAGRVDLIPSRFSRIPWLIESRRIRIDAAFIQISPPGATGYCSLGLGVDVARSAMEQAGFVVGEINENISRTLGDTLVHINDFDAIVRSTEPPIFLTRWAVTDVHDRLAANVASLIDNGSCISFSIGPIYDALAQHVSRKKDLGVHTLFFTDSLMDIVKSGAVSNRRKNFFRGKSLVSYALGTPELMKWLDRNPLVEFQPLNVTAEPKLMGLNDRFIAVMPARKADVTGGIALHTGQGNVTAGPGAVQEVFAGAELSRGGKTIFALPSRNRRKEPNILISVEDLPNQFTNRESLDMVVTEYGVAYLTGRTVRERAQALIDIAHPDDRADLVKKAKASRILYQDQIYLPESAHLYPVEIARSHTFKDDLRVHFRAIKPSDEDEMRRLFYRFSDKAVYYRYFSPIKTMPHSKMQAYVNVDYQDTMSIVGLTEEFGTEKLIAEARYAREPGDQYADTAFIIDEAYSGQGIATFLLILLIHIALPRGVKGFTADVLADNKPMLEVFKKSPFPMKAVLENQIYRITIPFIEPAAQEVQG